MPNLRASKLNKGVIIRDYYPVIIALIISTFVVLDFIYPTIIFPSINNWLLLHNELAWLVQNSQFVSKGDKLFVGYFVEWFGVLYGILLPLILVRAWEQFDEIERVFDKEIDTIKILSEDILLIDTENNEIKKKLLPTLMKYVNHVITQYKDEPSNNDSRSTGNKILKDIRKEYYSLIHQPKSQKKEPELLMQELLHQLNEVIDVRGDRLSLSTQRLFETLHLVSLFTSIIFIVPFYFLDISVISDTADASLGIFGVLLIAGVTFLVVFILTLIYDLDEPFYGKWKIEMDSWEEYQNDMKAELENLGVVVLDIS